MNGHADPVHRVGDLLQRLQQDLAHLQAHVPVHQDQVQPIRASRRAYERGIESVLAGDTVGGRRQLAAATDELVQQARDCSVQRPCSADLFLLSLADLYERRSHAMGATAARSSG